MNIAEILKSIGHGALSILLSLVFLIVLSIIGLFILSIFFNALYKLRYPALLKKHNGKKILVLSNKRGWHNVIQNSILPFNTEFKIVWHSKFSKWNKMNSPDYEFIATYNLKSIKRPFAIEITKDERKIYELNELLQKYKTNTKINLIPIILEYIGSNQNIAQNVNER